MSVKNRKRGRPVGGGVGLSREAIVAAAREWMLQENKRLSIRGLARQMGVDPMAIYHYFANKAALLEAITTSLMQEVYMPRGGPDWRGELTKLCISYLELLRQYPDLLETLLSMGPGLRGAAGVFAERFEAAVSPLALEPEVSKAALDLLVDYVHGVALAVRCAPGAQGQVDEMIREPLRLYFRALRHGLARG